MSVAIHELRVVKRPSLQTQKHLLCALVASLALREDTQAHLRVTHLCADKARKQPGTKQRSPAGN